MSQKVEDIIIKNILDILFLVHWMIFQNLSRKTEKEASNEVHMLFKIVIFRYEKESLNKLWAVETMKFQVAVSRDIVEVMFDSEAEINILFYSVILKLELIIQLNVMITIRDVSNKLLYIIKYISEVSVWIKNMIIW